MKTIEKKEDLVRLLDEFNCSEGESVLRLYDNKSDILLQTVVVRHPIMFIRGLQDFCKSINLPVSDLSIRFIGMIDKDSLFFESPEIAEISPYVYFTKPDSAESSVDD